MDLNKFDESHSNPRADFNGEYRMKNATEKFWDILETTRNVHDVCGKAGWRNEYRDIPNNGGVECGISIKIDSEWVTKWDAAENTQVEAVKGGRSGAMKRAAVQWGIGRYLYNLEEGFAQTSLDKSRDGTGQN